MSITLFSPPDFEHRPVTSLLESEGVSVEQRTWQAGRLIDSVPAEAKTVVLIVPSHGVVTIGEPTGNLKKAIASDARLIVCAPQPTSSDREQIHRIGASVVITPASWNGEAVAERILAELIMCDIVSPRKLGEMRGGVRQMRVLYEMIERIAPYSDPVLILGETGTGKELVAAAIHENSQRAAKPLKVLNCAAVSPMLLESALFGHIKGAFTGAVADHAEFVQAADGGTLFLDEIGDMPMPMQAKLLRTLESGEVIRVGTSDALYFDVRFLAATNRDLLDRVGSGEFREDLLARLAGLILDLAPLRDRRADLPWLAQGFLDENNKKESNQHTMPAVCFDCLFRYDWPNNVRELRQVVRKAAIFAQTKQGPVSTRVLQEATRRRARVTSDDRIEFDPLSDTWKDFVDRAWRTYSASLLKSTGRNKKAAAKRAGMSRSTFLERLAKLRTPDEEASGQE